jgi:predicted RNA binding protein YcfA (HicA-like mRNA interferase family)
MAQRDKRREKFFRTKRNMDVRDAIAVLIDLGFWLETQKGSEVTYVNDKEQKVHFHMPHPGHVLLQYAIKRIRKQLENYGINE